jgi:hypothetical protein
VRPKGERVGEIAAKATVQFLFSTGKSFAVDGLSEKLREERRDRLWVVRVIDVAVAL